MGFKDKIRVHHNYQNPTTRGFALGVPEAEGEILNGKLSFLNCFDDYLHTMEQILNGKFIIVGRKGSGKSAIAKYIMETAGKKEENIGCSLIVPHEYNLEKLIQSIPSNLSSPEDIIFEWLIETRLVKAILESKRATYSKGIQALSQFYKKNSGIVDVDQLMVLERNEEQQNQVNINPLKIFSFIIGRSFQAKEVRAPFYRLIPALRDILKEVLAYDDLKDYEFYIMFDDLDVNFKLSDASDKNRLLSLIRVARDYNNKYFKGTNAKVLLFLRDDISERLDGVNSDKTKMLESYSTRLYWYEHNIARYDEKKILLRQLINKRLQANFENFNIPFNHDDPWKSFVAEDYNAYGDRGSFRYILDFTFYRPRDIITIFKDVGNHDYTLPLSTNVVKGLLKVYFQVNVREIKDELSNLYTASQIQNIFSLFSAIAEEPHMAFEDVMRHAGQLGLTKADIENLIDYSYLVLNDDQNRQYFRYREDPIRASLKDYLYTLPKSLYGYFKPSIALN